MASRSPVIVVILASLALLLSTSLSACTLQQQAQGRTQLRLAVSLTPQEMETFEAQLDGIREAHPEWEILLETTPQAGLIERITTQLASGTLPDVVRLPGLNAQQWIRRDAFLDLTGRIEESGLDLGDFYPSPLEQFRWQSSLYGLPDTGSPSLVFYNMDLFDAAGVEYPDRSWTFEDMREAAIRLTLDGEGRSPRDPDFDPGDIQQWGWKGGITFYWQRDLLSSHGGEPCLNPDCTLMTFTSPELLQAVEWWATLVSEDHAAPYDPFSGAQTGIPGDPLLSGRTAMGTGSYFLIGQLREAGSIRYGITVPLLNTQGDRLSSLSSNGFLISARTDHPDEAWALVLALMEPEFLRDTWGRPGHSIPALRSVAATGLDPSLTAEERDVILETMEYSEVFRPYTASAFEVYARTSELFVQAMRRDLPAQEAMRQVEAIANQILRNDRAP
jgi:multiple sugar transport system substrate-binding protein